MDSKLAPIVLFVYNRPWHTRQTLEALSNNTLAGQSVLYVFADGVKEGASEQDINKIVEARKAVMEKKWCKEVHLIERERNFGLANNIIDGVTRIANEFGKVIVLEDDLVTSKGFLQHMNDTLTFYGGSNDVISISGYMYPVKEKLPETFFLRMADCWGWATWKRGWQLFEADAKKLLDELTTRNLSNEFDFMGNYSCAKMLEDQAKGKNYSWAIRWYASAFLKNKLTLYPHLSLVKHIGMNGTNYDSDPFLDQVNLTDEIKSEPIPIEESVEGRKAITDFFRERKEYLKKEDDYVPSFSFRLKKNIRKIIGDALYEKAKAIRKNHF